MIGTFVIKKLKNSLHYNSDQSAEKVSGKAFE